MSTNRTSVSCFIPNTLNFQGITGLATLDEANRFCGVSSAWAELLECTPQRWIGEPVHVLSNDPALAEALDRVAGGRGVMQLRRMYFALPSGRHLFADLALSPCDNGILLELHALVPDEDAAAPRLSESLRGFAHEVKNPLAGVRGAAQAPAAETTSPRVVTVSGPSAAPRQTTVPFKMQASPMLPPSTTELTTRE